MAQSKVKVETMAVIDRHPVGSTIELNERTAKRLEAMKYVRIIDDVGNKVAEPKKVTSAPKKATRSKPTKAKKEAKQEEQKEESK